MKQRIIWSAILAIALQIAILGLIQPVAQSQGPRRTPRAIRSVAPTGTDSGNCSGSPCATIQYAISQSSYGDQIDVASGTYTEHITMTNGVSIYGTGWDTTIINGNYSASQSTVTLPGGIDATTVLSGVQVTRGGTGVPETSPNGGGIRISGSSPTIINTWVYSSTGGWGGGVSVDGAEASPSFNNVPVWNNKALVGGGFYLVSGSPITITGNPLMGTNGTIWWNSASSLGGGIYAGNNVTLKVSGLRIYGNTASSGGGIFILNAPNLLTFLLNDISGNSAMSGAGAGIRAQNASQLYFVGNSIGNRVYGVGGNKASGSGGGAFFEQSAGTIQSNWFMDNVADSGGAITVYGGSLGMTFVGNWIEGNQGNSGGGFYLASDSVSRIEANTVVSNTAGYGGGIHVIRATAMITNSIFARNTVTITGGAMQYLLSAANLVNNVIADNTGDGVYLQATTGIKIINNVVYGNSGNGIVLNGDTTYLSDYNDVNANTPNYSGLAAGAHDLSVNPLFIGSGDMKAFYHIQATSPISRTGSMTWAPPNDIDGEARILLTSMGADHLPITIRKLFLPLIMR